MRSPLLWKALALGYSLLLIWMMWAPADGYSSEWFPHQDKLAHIALYGLLCLLWWRAGLSPLLAAVAALLWSALLEGGQGLTDARSMDFWDLLANGLGVLMAWALLQFQGRRPEGAE